jgi:hypothetical protein
VLLGLISHGILSVAHTHPAFSHKDNASASILIADGDDQSGHTPESNNHSQCPLCQLQRIFTTGLRSPSIILELPSEYLDREFSPAESISRGPVLVLSDRAPPLA